MKILNLKTVAMLATSMMTMAVCAHPTRRTFTLDLTWKFNEAQSKYRGKGAGEQQKARM